MSDRWCPTRIRPIAGHLHCGHCGEDFAPFATALIYPTGSPWRRTDLGLALLCSDCMELFAQSEREASER